MCDFLLMYDFGVFRKIFSRLTSVVEPWDLNSGFGFSFAGCPYKNWEDLPTRVPQDYFSIVFLTGVRCTYRDAKVTLRFSVFQIRLASPPFSPRWQDCDKLYDVNSSVNWTWGLPLLANLNVRLVPLLLRDAHLSLAVGQLALVQRGRLARNGHHICDHLKYHKTLILVRLTVLFRRDI